jgi:glucose uptake protein GlcU
LSWQQRSVSVYHVVLDYVAVDAAADRVWAWLAGVVCALGNVLQFQGGQRVGYATADLVQAYPLISTIWDIFLFGEFATVRMKSHLGCLLLGMYASYLAGIFLLAASSMQE